MTDDLTDDLTGAERALRDLLAARAAEVSPPAGVYATVRTRTRRRRVVLGAGLTAALAAGGVPAALAATRTDAAPAGPPATAPADDSCADWRSRRVADPRLPAQRDVLGSLGGDPAAVTAVAEAGWGAMRSDGELDVGRTRVQAVQRTTDGWILGVVTGSDRAGRLAFTAHVAGRSLTDLRSGMFGGGIGGEEPILTRFAGGDSTGVDFVGCGPDRVVVIGPPGSEGRVSWIAGIRADATVDRRTERVAVGPDGVGVAARPAPGQDLAVRVVDDGRVLTVSALSRGPHPLTGPDEPTLARLLQAAPGDADPGIAAKILARQSWEPSVPQADPRVVWAGGRGPVTTAVAMTRLEGGAWYVWGGLTVGPWNGGAQVFEGLLPSAGLAGSAFRFESAVFFDGTHRVDITSKGSTRTETVTGGLFLDPGATVVVRAADGTAPADVDVQTDLPRPSDALTG